MSQYSEPTISRRKKVDHKSPAFECPETCYSEPHCSSRSGIKSELNAQSCHSKSGTKLLNKLLFGSHCNRKLQVVRVPRLNLLKCRIGHTKVEIYKSTSNNLKILQTQSAEIYILQTAPNCPVQVGDQKRQILHPYSTLKS